MKEPFKLNPAFYDCLLILLSVLSSMLSKEVPRKFCRHLLD